MSRLAETAPDIAEEAALWFARRRHRSRPGEERRFLSWLEADPAHRVAYERVTLAWEIAGAGASDPEIAAMRADALMVRPKSRLTSGPWMQVAAIMLLLLCASTYVALSWTGDAPERLTRNAPREFYQTGVGQRTTLTLEDGSVVTLNTNSRLAVSYSATRRDLTLLAGQALFQVTKNPARPFIVTAGTRQVIAVGTEFEVRLDKSNVRVALIEGKVKVQPVNTRPAAGQADAQALQAVAILEPGEQLIASSAGMSTVSAVDVAGLTSWREGRVRFDDTPLRDAVAEMNRYTRTPIVIADPAISDLRVSGAFRTGQIRSFVSSIAEILPVSAQDEGGTVHLYGKHAKKI